MEEWKTGRVREEWKSNTFPSSKHSIRHWSGLRNAVFLPNLAIFYCHYSDFYKLVTDFVRTVIEIVKNQIIFGENNKT
jgi:hypothetical protein